MKITTRSVMRRCGCRSVGECNHNLTAPIKALDKLVDEFAKEMKRKLLSKMMRDAKYGWDDPGWTVEQIRRQLVEHVDKGDPIDIANFAAFWWNKI